jgi:hypothetical protein
MITLTLTTQHFLYIQESIERDLEDARDQIMFGPDDEAIVRVFDQAQSVLRLLRDVEQGQVVTF